MIRILFDTDVLIELLNENKGVTQEFRKLCEEETRLFISPVSIAELYHGIKPKEEPDLLDVLDLCVSIEVDATIGKLAGQFLSQHAKSHALEVADALIAATAVHHSFALCTFNWKHYPMKDIERYIIKR